MEKTMLKLFQYSRGTYYSWKKEKRPIIQLIEKYFSSYDLEEFLEHGYISKMNKVKYIHKERNRLYKMIDPADRVQKACVAFIAEKFKNQDTYDDLYTFIINIGLENIKQEIVEIEDNPDDPRTHFLGLMGLYQATKLVDNFMELIKQLTPLQIDLLVNEYDDLFTSPYLFIKDREYRKEDREKLNKYY